MGLDILVAGVGDAFAIELEHTHYYLREDDFVLAVDSPDHHRRILHERAFPHKGRSLMPEDLHGVIITHLHGDHVNGLEMMLIWCRFILNHKLKIFTHPHAAEAIWDQRLAASLGQSYAGEGRYQSWSLEDYADLVVIDFHTPTSIGPWTVTFAPTTHHLPTAAIRVDSQHGRFASSSDTTFDEELVEWLCDGADLVFHECTPGKGHTQLSDLLALEADKKRKLRLFHYPDSLVGSDVEIEMLQEGQVLTISK